MCSLPAVFRRPLAAAALTLLAAGAAPAAAPPRYTAVDLGVSRTGTYLAGVNEAGQVAGQYYTQDSSGLVARAMLVSPDGLTTLPGAHANAYDVNNAGVAAGRIQLPNANGREYAAVWTSAGVQTLGDSGQTITGSRAYALNDAGLVVGYARPAATGTNTAALWKDGSLTLLAGLGGAGSSEARDVNSAGVITGIATRAGQPRPVVWENGAPRELGTLGGETGYPTAINCAGWVVGYSQLSGNAGIHATLWKDGAVVDLGLPGSATGVSFAHGINDRGDVIGRYTADGSFGHRLFLHSDGVTYDFLSLLDRDIGMTDFLGNDYPKINNAGQFAIVGIVNGVPHNFLFTPVGVPEPGAAGLASCAVSGALLRRRRRR